jgi:hypothetical protein
VSGRRRQGATSSEKRFDMGEGGEAGFETLHEALVAVLSGQRGGEAPSRASCCAAEYALGPWKATSACTTHLSISPAMIG